MELQFTSPRRREALHFRLAALILVPLFALIFQAYLPLYFSFVTFLNLPLLVVIYFALGGRNPVAGLFAGALIGLMQDSISGRMIGLFAITNTIIGYAASFVSTRLDTENSGVRFLSTFIFCQIHFLCIFLLGSILPGETAEFAPLRNLLAALVNSLAGVLLFKVLDRFRKPA